MVTPRNVFHIIEVVMTKDPSTSYWLRGALKEALSRNAEDASNDADYLASILKMRAEAFRTMGGRISPTTKRV
jgi:hypothetical protein